MTGGRRAASVQRDLRAVSDPRRDRASSGRGPGRRGPARLVLAAACVACLVTASGGVPTTRDDDAAGFLDPLDVPARTSALAARVLLTDVASAGARVVAVGQRGHAIWSDDGGATWTQAIVPVSTDLTAVQLAGQQRGWAVGHGGVILVTEDGGRSWRKLLDRRQLSALLARHYATPGGHPAGLAEQVGILAGEGEDASFLDVWFGDERTGFAVGAFNLILATEDGGRSWTPWLDRSDNPLGLHLYAIAPAAGGLFIVGEQGLVLKLDEARRRFVAVATPAAGTLFGVIGDGDEVVGYGLRGALVRSGDGGATWSRVAVGLDVSFTGAARAPDGRMLLVSQQGDVLSSDDGGASFRSIAVGRRAPTSAAALVRVPPPAATAAAPGGEGVGSNVLVLVGRGGARAERLP